MIAIRKLHRTRTDGDDFWTITATCLMPSACGYFARSQHCDISALAQSSEAQMYRSQYTWNTHLLDATKLDLNDLICQAVLPSRGNVGDIAPGPRRQHHPVFQEGVLLHCCINVTACQPVPSLQMDVQKSVHGHSVIVVACAP